MSSLLSDGEFLGTSSGGGSTLLSDDEFAGRKASSGLLSDDQFLNGEPSAKSKDGASLPVEIGKGVAAGAASTVASGIKGAAGQNSAMLQSRIDDAKNRLKAMDLIDAGKPVPADFGDELLGTQAEVYLNASPEERKGLRQSQQTVIDTASDPYTGEAPPSAGPTGKFEGMAEPGNIDLANRPKVKMPDGSIATVRSASFNIDGKEVLLPTVSPDGKLLSNQEAIELYRKTGQHLGKFDTPEHADVYAEALHQAQDQFYNRPETGLSDAPLFKAGTATQNWSDEQFKAAKDYEGSWTRAISEGLGSTVPFLLTGPSSGLVAGSFASSGQQIDDAIAHGATKEQILQAVKLGGIPGLTEQMPIEMLFERIPLPLYGKFANAIGKVLAQAAAEGGQEMLQQVAQNLIASYVYNPDQDISEGVLQAGAIGAIIGGSMKTVMPHTYRKDGEPEKPAKGQDIPQGAADAGTLFGQESAGGPPPPPADTAAGGPPPPSAATDRPNSPRLTAEDRASPLPNDLIDDGRKIFEEALGGKPSSDTVSGRLLGDDEFLSHDREADSETTGRRNEGGAGVSGVGVDEAAVLQQEEQKLPDVRRTRDNGLPGVDERLLGVLPGDRTAPESEALGGPDRRNERVSAGQREVGNTAPTIGEPPRVRQELGRADSSAESKRVVDSTLDASGTLAQDAVGKGSDTGTAPTRQSIPAADLSGGDKDAGGVGENAKLRQEHAALAVKPGVVSGKGAVDANVKAPSEPSFLASVDRAAFDKAPQANRDVAMQLGSMIDQMRAAGNAERADKLQPKLDAILKAIMPSAANAAAPSEPVRAGMKTTRAVTPDILKSVLNILKTEPTHSFDSAVDEAYHRKLGGKPRPAPAAEETTQAKSDPAAYVREAEKKLPPGYSFTTSTDGELAVRDAKGAVVARSAQQSRTSADWLLGKARTHAKAAGPVPKAEQKDFSEEDIPAFLRKDKAKREEAAQSTERGPMYQARTIREGKETPKDLGLDKKRSSTREIAEALQTRQRDRYGTIARDDRSSEAQDRISNWMVDEVLFEMQPGREKKSGVGWYSYKFQSALDKFGAMFPEIRTGAGLRGADLPGLKRLKTKKNARDFLTALIAVTSDGQKVAQNFQYAAQAYEKFRQTGRIDANVTYGADRNLSIRTNLENINTLLDKYGPEGMHKMLMEEHTVSDLKKIAAQTGADFSTSYQAHVRLPLAAVIFGPKLGAFYSNLMGSHGYLTMDRWWSRTFNRYRGQLLTAVTGTKERPTDARGNKIGLARFKDMLGDPEMSDDAALVQAAYHSKLYEEKGFKGGTDVEKAANTIKKDTLGTEDMPFSATDRTFMIETTERARQKLANQGLDISMADIQAVLWYFEKRLYSELGAKETADISYEDIAAKVAGAIAGNRSVGSDAQDVGAGPDGTGAGDSSNPSADQGRGRGPLASEAGARLKVADQTQPTDAFKDQAQAIGTRLRAELDRLGLKDIGLRISENLGLMVEGKFHAADGSYFQKLVTVALDAENPDSVLDHEAIHALRDVGAFTKDEWAILERKSRKEWRDRYAIADAYGSFPDAVQTEEGIAHAYADWRAGRSMDGIIAKAFKKIRAVIQAIGKAFGKDFRSAEDVFAQVASGEVGNRSLADEQISKDETSFKLRNPQTAEDRQKTMQGMIARGQPLDRALRLPFQFFGGVDERGRWKPGLYMADKAAKIITTAKIDPEGRFGWMAGPVEAARAGLIDRYGLSPEYIERDRQRHMDERAITMRGAEVLKTLAEQNVGANEARVLQAILTGEAVSDKDMGQLAAPIRQAIDELGQEAVSLGLISAESFERNRGSYLHRVYAKHEAEQNNLQKLVSQIMGSKRKKIIGDTLKGRGLFWEVDSARLNGGNVTKGEKYRVLDKVSAEDAGGKVTSRVYLPADQDVPSKYTGPEWRDNGTWEARQIGKGKVTLWRDYTQAERGKMGEILDARYTIGKTYIHMAHDLAVGRFYKDVAANEDWATASEPATKWVEADQHKRLVNDREVAWVKVPDTTISNTGGKKRWGALSGKWVRSEIWRDLNEIDIMNRPSTWRMLLSQWKLNKTARSPVTHMNNVMSNMMLMDMNDVRMQDLQAGLRSFVKKDKHWQDAMEHGVFGADMMTQEIRDNVLKPILEEIEKQGQDGVQNSFLARAGILGKFADRLWSLAKTADRKMIDLYRIEDDVFRLASYRAGVARGETAEHAAAAAREQFFDYDIRAPWVNAARNSLFPFISYTYRAVPLIARALATKPWKVAKYAMVAYALNALAYAWDDEGDEDKERASLRDQEQGKTWLGTYRMMRMPFRNADGLPVFLDTRRWIPGGDIFDTNQGSSALPIPAPLQFGGPLMLAFELALNKSGFTGDPITNDLTDTWFDKSSKVGDYLWKSWLPSAAWVPNSWYWTKIENAAKGATDAQGRPYSLPEAVASSVGIKLKPQDVETGVYWHYKDMKDVEQALRAEARTLARQRDRGLISQKAFDSGMQALLDKRDVLVEHVKELQRATRKK